MAIWTLLWEVSNDARYLINSKKRLRAGQEVEEESIAMKSIILPARSIATSLAAGWHPLLLGSTTAYTAAKRLAGLVTAVPYRLRRRPSLAGKQTAQDMNLRGW